MGATVAVALCDVFARNLRMRRSASSSAAQGRGYGDKRAFIQGTLTPNPLSRDEPHRRGSWEWVRP